MTYIKNQLSKFKDKNYKNKFCYDFSAFLILQLITQISAIYLIGKVIGGEPKWYFFAVFVIMSAISLFVLFKKRTLTPKGIIFLIVICIITIPISSQTYTALNKAGYKNSPCEYTFSGKVVKANYNKAAKNKYYLVSLSGESCTIYSDETLYEDDEPTVNKYNGNFNMPIYIIEEK